MFKPRRSEPPGNPQRRAHVDLPHQHTKGRRPCQIRMRRRVGSVGWSNRGRGVEACAGAGEAQGAADGSIGAG